MANQYGKMFTFTKIPDLWMIRGAVTFGASGAVATVSGKGVNTISNSPAGVVKLTTGIYAINLTDTYSQLMFASFDKYAATTTTVVMGSLVTNIPYQILTLGNTTKAQWVTAGFPSNQVPQVGSTFVAAAAGAGTGTVQTLTNSGLVSIGLLPGSNFTGITTPYIASQTGTGCSQVKFQTMNSSNVPVDPTSGAAITFMLHLRNSSAPY